MTFVQTQLTQCRADCDLLTQQLEERGVKLSQEVSSCQRLREELRQQLEQANQEAVSYCD